MVLVCLHLVSALYFSYCRTSEKSSANRMNFLDMKDKDGEDIIQLNTLKRCQKCSEFMHMAASSPSLDPATRADVALRCISIAWRGVRPTVMPTIRERSSDRIQLKRKAAFFAVTAAEAMSDVQGGMSNQRANAMWSQASKLLSQTGNDLVGGNYGWATLRAVALHALVVQGTRESSEEAAKQLLTLVSEISPRNRPKNENLKSSPTKDGRRSSYFAGARSYLRESAKVVAKDARTRSKEIFGNDISSLLVVQSKWVEDDPLDSTLLPMGDFSSDFSHLVLAMPSVWSTIKFEHCSYAQEQLIQQIFDVRKTIPTSTLLSVNSPSNNQKLPIEITAIGIMSSDSSAKLERVTVKRKVEKKENAMSTFFNPYAKQERKQNPITIPRGEEQYLSILFSNKLATPFAVDSCRLEFDTTRSDQIKAPSISFVIPGRSKSFAVHFPFVVLDKLDDSDIDTLGVKGISITALSRLIFLPLGETGLPKNTEEQVIPKSMSFYSRRDYSKTSRLEDQKSSVIYSPRLEIIPPQPSVQVSFASSTTPIDGETIIPVFLADGEIFTLPKMCVSNDTGLHGIGRIEELQISAIGLPGLSDVVLYDMSRAVASENGSLNSSRPISISALCEGLDAETLNSSTRDPANSFIAAKLSASPTMGAQTNGCHLTLRFRYRGKTVSPTLEVWRKYEVQIHVLRVKGPKIPSLSFRCDLFWESGYSELCNALDTNRLGQDSGVHVCSDEVAVIVSVANESPSPIVLSRMDDSPIGFAESTLESLKVSKGIGVKFPIILRRVERSSDVCRQLTEMIKFEWKSDIPGSDLDDAQVTGGPMFPVNQRVRQGILEIPQACLKKIMDENPIFLSRICKAPCSIGVDIICKAPSSLVGTVDESTGAVSQQQLVKNVRVGKPVDIAVTVEMAKWLSSVDPTERTRWTLEFCCARRNSSPETAAAAADTKENCANNGSSNRNGSKDFVWIGQVRKNLRMEQQSFVGKNETDPHRARIVFLKEGDYFVSACLSLSGSENEDVKEIWWAKKAAKIHVSKSQ